MHDRQARRARQTGRFRHRQDRPERHTVADLARFDPGNHEATRLSGILTTLDRISHLTVIAGT